MVSKNFSADNEVWTASHFASLSTDIFNQSKFDPTEQSQTTWNNNINFLNVLNDTNLKIPILKYHELSFRIIGTIIMTIIFLVGVIGNSMVILVVWKCKNMRSPTNCYLVSLAFSDLLLLFSATFPSIVEFHLREDEFVAGNMACKGLIFSQYLGFNLSSLSITALTAERYVAICKPMKAHAICTVKRAKKIIASLWLFGFCYSAPWLALITTKQKFENFDQCTFSLSREQYKLIYLADLMIMYLIPVIVNIGFYTLISKTLYYSKPISAAFGDDKNFGAATSSLCKNSDICDNDSKLGSFKNSSANSSFCSYKNNENLSSIRNKFHNESIKSFTLLRNDSRNNKSIGSFTKKSWKPQNLKFFMKDENSNRIYEEVEEKSSNAKKGNESEGKTEFDTVLLEKQFKNQNKINLENEKSNDKIEGSAGESLKNFNVKYPVKKQLQRQPTLFHETLGQTNMIRDNKKGSVTEKMEKIDNEDENQEINVAKSQPTVKFIKKKFSNCSRSTKLIHGDSFVHPFRRKPTTSFVLPNSELNEARSLKTRSSTLLASGLSASVYGSNPIHSRTQIIKMLVVVVSLFAVLWLPYRAFVVYNSFVKTRYENIWLMLICRIMVHTNSAINPILYNAMSAKFKKAFKSLLTCDKRKLEKSTTRRGAVECNLNYNRREVFLNMYEKNYKELIRNKSIKQ